MDDYSKRLDPGSQAGMTQNIAWWDLFRGNLSTIPPFHLSTSKAPFHGLIVAPIYYGGGMGLICISLSGVGLPGVNLIIYKDDLRMMAQNPVVAKEGAMRNALV